MQVLSLLSDILLIGATLGLAAWCRLLSVRLRAFNDADKGTDGAIAGLAAQVEALKTSVKAAEIDTSDRDDRLADATARADDRIGRMEMLLASLEDLEEERADRLMQDPASVTELDGIPNFRASRPQGQEGHS